MYIVSYFSATFTIERISMDLIMAAKGFDISDIKKQEELEDMTTCCICTEVFTEPKALPCLHAFCYKCIQKMGLKSNKEPGDEMPCPICRQLFKIPTGGFRGLPKHFILERLIQVANGSEQSTSSRVICDACSEEDDNEAGREIPDADTYCFDCRQRFCCECSRHHRRVRLTKNHKLIPIDEREAYLRDATNTTPNVCELHENKCLDVYCSDCTAVVCAFCFIEKHNNHKGFHVDKCVADFRKELTNNAERINDCISQVQMKRDEFLQVKEEIKQRMEILERDIGRRCDDVKRFADKDAKRVMQSLYSAGRSRLKEIQMAMDGIAEYLGNIESYNSHCQQITDKGSASDICGAFADLSIRALALQQQCPEIIQSRIKDFKICFRESELEEFQQEDGDNLIGEIEEDDDSEKPRKLSKQSSLAEHIKEIECLKGEIETEREEKEDLRSAYEELKVTLSQELQEAQEAFTEEIKREKDNHEAHIKELEHELENNTITIDTHQINSDELEQELDKQKIASTALQYEIDKLKQELDKETRTNKALQAKNNELQQKLDKEKSDNSTLQAANCKLVEEVNLYKTTIRTLEDSVERLKQEPESAQTGHMTNDEMKRRTLRNYVQFVSDADPDLLGDYLKQEGVISIDQWMSITAQKCTTKDKCRAVLDFLLSINHPSAFIVIQQALGNKDHFQHLLKTITKKDMASAQELKTELNDRQQLAVSKPESINTLVARIAEVEHTHITASKEIIYSQGLIEPQEEEQLGLLMLRQNKEEQFLNIDVVQVTQKQQGE